MSYYKVIDNKIHAPRGCELNVVHHCNLSCRACSHLSPTLKKHAVNAEDVFRDFSALANHYAPHFIKLLGGEPLLHPGLLDVIDAVRSSGISSRIHVCTNGLLLSRMPTQFWEKVDLVEISVYPGVHLDYEQLKQACQHALDWNAEFVMLYHNFFREAYTEEGTEDQALVQRIYRTCKVAHIWGCNTVYDGYFFKCPQSIFISQVLQKNPEGVYQNGLKISDSVDFRVQLHAYLESPQPLSACDHCLGSVGKLIPQTQQDRRHWRAAQQHPTEELLDEAFLAQLEQNPEANDPITHRISPGPEVRRY